MPSSTPELCAEWHGPDSQYAMDFLKRRGFTLNPDWTWYPPNGREPTDKELRAIDFLFQEWDFGGLAP